MDAYGQPPQGVMTVPLLQGTDGVQKMSKSYGNYIGVNDPPEEMFGKVMSIPDESMVTYWTLLTGAGYREVEDVQRRLAKGTYHPADAKRDLAERLVSLYYSPEAAAAARAHFDRVFRQHEEPEDMLESPIPPSAVKDGRVWLPRLLVETGLAASNGEARRLVQQGAVRVGGDVVTDPGTEFAPEELAGSVIQVGRRRFVRVIAP